MEEEDPLARLEALIAAALHRVAESQARAAIAHERVKRSERVLDSAEQLLASVRQRVRQARQMARLVRSRRHRLDAISLGEQQGRRLPQPRGPAGSFPPLPVPPGPAAPGAHRLLPLERDPTADRAQ
jgi:hypothetical protein